MSISRRQLLAGSAAMIATGPTSTLWAAEGRVTLAGGTIWQGKAEPLKNAVVDIDDGKVVSITSGSASGTHVIDVTGKVVTAGLVDLLTNTGVIEVSLEPSTRDDRQAKLHDPVRAAFRTADGYNPASSIVPITRREGLTSVGVIPHEGLVPGQSAWADLSGATPGDALASTSLALHVNLHDGAHGHFDGSRGTAMLRLRELFDDARAFKANPRGYDRRELRNLGASRLDLLTVVRALDGELPVFFHVDRASAIVSVLKLAADNNLDAVLASAAEAWKVASQIAAANVPAIVYPLDHGPRSFAALGAREDNAARLHRAGVRIALSTGSTHNARKLRQAAGNAVRAGLPHRAALDAVTDAPARICKMDDYGSLQKGRVANIAVWSGDPFELSSRGERMFIRGREVSLQSRQTALFERYR